MIFNLKRQLTCLSLKNMEITFLHRLRFINDPTDWGSMAKEKKPEMRYQCLGCYKTHKTEQKALDCCGSMIQAWCINYNKWGKQHWYGR